MDMMQFLSSKLMTSLQHRTRLGTQPSLRRDVTHGTGESLVALARAASFQGHDVIEYEMPFVECMVSPLKWNGTAPVLVKEPRSLGGVRGGRQYFRGH